MSRTEYGQMFRSSRIHGFPIILAGVTILKLQYLPFLFYAALEVESDGAGDILALIV